MTFLILIVVAVVTGSKCSHLGPIGVTVGITPYSHPISSLYHSQDSFGQYSYGYATPTATKAETKTIDGVTHGGYSYIDSNGILQTVQYISDPVYGFRVAATNLPQDLPEVAAAKAQHLAQYASISAENAKLAVKYTNPVVQDLPEVVAARAQHLDVLNAAYAGILQTPQDLPEVVKARAEHLAIVEQTKARDAAAHLSPIHLIGNVVPIHTSSMPNFIASNQISYTPASISSQYHAQDGLGQYSYGYVGPLSSKAETKSADGVTRGGYSYIDANGILQTVNYIADAVNGFRVAATNLPVGPQTPITTKKILSKTIAPGLYTQEIYY